jgi:hypothetical protein
MPDGCLFLAKRCVRTRSGFNRRCRGSLSGSFRCFPKFLKVMVKLNLLPQNLRSAEATDQLTDLVSEQEQPKCGYYRPSEIGHTAEEFSDVPHALKSPGDARIDKEV